VTESMDNAICAMPRRISPRSLVPAGISSAIQRHNRFYKGNADTRLGLCREFGDGLFCSEFCQEDGDMV
jgi:hypothetical protein